MAELTVFSFHPGNSFLHNRDARFKIAGMGLLTASLFQADFRQLLLLFLLLLVLMRSTGIAVIPALRELRLYALLLLFVFLARAFSTPGEPIVQIGPAAVTIQGATVGMLVCTRLLLTALAGIVLVATTRIADVRSAIVWYLSPVPGIPEKRIGTMVGLLVRFLPLVVSQARLTRDIQRARGVENRKNPVARLRIFSIALLRRIFLRADRMALAMNARCYNEDAYLLPHSATPQDWLLLAAAVLLFILVTADAILYAWA